MCGKDAPGRDQAALSLVTQGVSCQLHPCARLGSKAVKGPFTWKGPRSRLARWERQGFGSSLFTQSRQTDRQTEMSGSFCQQARPLPTLLFSFAITPPGNMTVLVSESDFSEVPPRLPWEGQHVAITPAPVVLAGVLGGLLPAEWSGGALAPTSVLPSLLGSSAFLKRNVLLITPSDFLLGTAALTFPRKGRGLNGKTQVSRGAAAKWVGLRTVGQLYCPEKEKPSQLNA